jgi:hypothetical protein
MLSPVSVPGPGLPFRAPKRLVQIARSSAASWSRVWAIDRWGVGQVWAVAGSGSADVVSLMVLALLCTPCSTTARSNRMNVSRRPVLGVSYRLPAAPCVANACGPSLGPEQPVGVSLVVLALLCTSCSTTARSNRMNVSRRHVLGVRYRLLVAPCVANECGPSPGPEQCVFVPFLSFSLCCATPFTTTARSNRTTFMRRHVAGSGRVGPGVARILATLWAVGSGRRPCAGGACGGGWFWLCFSTRALQRLVQIT